MLDCSTDAHYIDLLMGCKHKFQLIQINYKSLKIDKILAENHTKTIINIKYQLPFDIIVDHETVSRRRLISNNDIEGLMYQTKETLLSYSSNANWHSMSLLIMRQSAEGVS